MNSIYIIDNIKEYVEKKLKNDKSGHDYYHVERVVNLAKRIAKEESANIFICEVAALLHDVIDHKVVDDEEKAIIELKDFLKTLKIGDEDFNHIIYIITNMSFKGGNGKTLESLEGRIVQDADRLDAIGAIGIARTMIFTGAKGRTLHIPNLKPRENMTVEEYRSSDGTTINHFYEKLLKLKDLMNTDTAKKLAEGRSEFLELYLKQFYDEWDGVK